MKPLYYDVEHHVMLAGETVPEARASGLCIFISYGRLIDQLRAAGEFDSNERVRMLVLDGDGITYYLVRNEPGS